MFLKDITRGGQTNLHNLTMFKQVVIATIYIGLIVSSITFGALTYNKISKNQFLMVVDYYIADFKYNIMPSPDKDIREEIDQELLSRNRTVKSKAVLKSRNYIINKNRTKSVLKENIATALKAWGVAIIVVLIIWGIFGKSGKSVKFIRGAKIIGPLKLKRLIRRKKRESKYKLCDFENRAKYSPLTRKYRLPFLKNCETSHTLITGTTGAGKTNCLKGILRDLREKKQKVVVIDITGEFTSLFYREGKDHILNPFDERSEKWSVWADCRTFDEVDQVAAGIFEVNYGTEPFWSESAKLLFVSAILKLQKKGEKSLKKLFKHLIFNKFKDSAEFFSDTPASALYDPNNEKTSACIRATITSKIKPFNFLDDIDPDKAFSIKKWIKREKIETKYEDKQDDSWLFISASPTQRETMKPLISIWLDLAISGLMEERHDDKKIRWFVIDELAGLNRVVGLPKLLAESRKYKGAVIAATQNLPQLYNIYRLDLTKSLLDLFGTKIIFRTTESSTSEELSKIFGSQEITEKNETTSYGANSIRDGVSISNIQRTVPLIMPSELSLLDNLECYVKYPEDYPITKLKMSLHKIENIANDFVIRNVSSLMEIAAEKEPIFTEEQLEGLEKLKKKLIEEKNKQNSEKEEEKNNLDSEKEREKTKEEAPLNTDTDSNSDSNSEDDMKNENKKKDAEYDMV